MKRASLFVLIASLSLLFACRPAAAPPAPMPASMPSLPPAPTATPMPTPTAASSFDAARLGTVERDLIYCVVDGVPLTMDVYFPSSGGPWPAIVSIHGGGWMAGDKASVDTSMVARGYLVVSINYRLYPAARFPAMIQDVKCAIRSLRAYAADFNLDPGRIGLTGHSAGGHLAALAGLADESAGFDVGEHLEQSSRVQAVLVSAGPADLTRPFPDYLAATVQEVFGPEQLVGGSPVTYASRDDPPFLILHGDWDDTVPVEQGQALYERLISASVSAQLLIVHNANHSIEPAGGPLSPTWDELARMIVDFWDWNLR